MLYEEVVLLSDRDIIIERKLYELSKSRFRSSFHLRRYMIEYIDNNGFDIIGRHAKDFINVKLGPVFPKNDGHQTPMRGHPVFIAMHACACCCRGCLEKWHGIPRGRLLKNTEKNYIYCLLMMWIKSEYNKSKGGLI